MSNPFPPSRSDHEPVRPAAVRHTRRQEIEEVGRLWTSNRLTILNGHPGVGKTTLLRSGVIPSLEEDGRLLLPMGRVTHHVVFPRAALPPQNHFVFPLLSSWAPEESPAGLSESSIQRFLEQRLAHDRFGEPSSTHLCIDQAETLFREYPNFQKYPEREAQRLRFLEDLFDALRRQPHLRLLLALRTTFLGQAQAFAAELEAEEISTGRFELKALRPEVFGENDWRKPLAEELRTIRAPEEREVSTTRVDPSLFGLVCARLGPAPPRNPAVLTAEVDHVLGEHVGQTLAAVAADHRMSAPQLKAWFHDAFIEVGRTDRPDGSPFPAKVLRALEDKWLIRAGKGPGGTGYEVRHPRLRQAVRAFPAEQVPTCRTDAAGLLREAAAAFWSGDLPLSRNQVEDATRTCRPQDLEVKAQAECLLGDLAYADGEIEQAMNLYKTAAIMFEVLQNTHLVGHLLSADGRLSLKTDPPTALSQLHAAISRLPRDPHVLTALGQALWQTGQPHVALTVLNEVLNEDRSNLEALRIHREIQFHLDEDGSPRPDPNRIDVGAGGDQP